MLFKIAVFVLLVLSVKSEESDENYVDAVINMLLNGDDDGEFGYSNEDQTGHQPVLTGGIWKCGNCNDITESNLVYTEVNEVDAEMANDNTVDVQIGLTVQGMQCITVTADAAGIVRRVSGACNGSTVTLNVAPAQHYTVRVYS